MVLVGGVLAVGLVTAALFVLPGPPQPGATLREPGHFGRLEQVDLLPGYSLDAERRRLGPARLLLHDGTRLFLPARTPYSGARPCPALTPPEGGDVAGCAMYAWFDQDTREVHWLTLLRAGGPNEALLTGRLLSAGEEQLVLDQGLSIHRGPSFRLSECGDRELREVVGADVVVSVDAEQGLARQVTCRS